MEFQSPAIDLGLRHHLEQRDQEEDDEGSPCTSFKSHEDGSFSSICERDIFTVKKHQLSPQMFAFSPELNPDGLNQKLLSKFDVDYSPTKTDFSKTIFLDADFNQITFKNGVQFEDSWSPIDPRQRKNYRVIIHCSNTEEKRRTQLEQALKNPSLEHQLENIEAQFQYLLQNIDGSGDTNESYLQALAAQLRSNDDQLAMCQEYQ